MSTTTANIFEGAYFILNSDNKTELYLDGKEAYANLPESVKSEIKRAFVWGRQRGAWVSRSIGRGIPYGFEKYGIPVKGMDERKTFEESREQKNERAENKADRYEMYAESRDREATSLQADFNRFRSDWSWLTQPNINTSGGRRFTRQRENIMARYDRGMESRRIAKSHRERAESLRISASESELKNESYLINRVKEGEKAERMFQDFVKDYAEKLDNIDAQPDAWKIWLQARLNHYQTQFERLQFFGEALESLAENKKQAGQLNHLDINDRLKGIKKEVKEFFKRQHGIDVLQFSKAFGTGVNTYYYLKTAQDMPERYHSGWASPCASQVKITLLIQDIDNYSKV